MEPEGLFPGPQDMHEADYLSPCNGEIKNEGSCTSVCHFVKSPERVEPLVKQGHRQECDTVMNFGDMRCNVLSDFVPCKHEERVRVNINQFLTLVLYTELSCQLDTPAILPLMKETQILDMS
jgi:hypothetical protein